MQNTNSSAIKKHWAHTNDHSLHGVKISWLEHNLGAKSKKENTAPSRGALVPWWGSGGGCLIVLASWILFRKYGYLQWMESQTGKSTPRVAFIFPNEEISLWLYKPVSKNKWVWVPSTFNISAPCSHQGLRMTKTQLYSHYLEDKICFEDCVPSTITAGI